MESFEIVDGVLGNVETAATGCWNWRMEKASQDGAGATDWGVAAPASPGMP